MEETLASQKIAKQKSEIERDGVVRSYYSESRLFLGDSCLYIEPLYALCQAHVS